MKEHIPASLQMTKTQQSTLLGRGDNDQYSLAKG